MKEGLKRLFLIGIASASLSSAVAQTPPHDLFTSRAHDDARPLRIEIRSSLDFSRVTTGNKGGQIALDPNSGGRSITGDVVELGGSPFAGNAIVTGEPGRAIRIEIPPAIRLTSGAGGSIQIVNLRTNLSAAPRLDMTGRLEFAFGGDLIMKGNVAGEFRGRISITAEYE
ncbi:MAG: DUF4402 domain-containing protein [Sphingorhabdus sp.]